MNWMRKAFNFCAEAIEAHREMRRDVAKDAIALDAYVTDTLISEMNQEAYVRLDDVKEFARQLALHQRFQCSEYDTNAYLAPFFRTLQGRIERAEMPAYLKIFESVDAARVKVSDLLAYIQYTQLPDGAQDMQRVALDVVVAVDETEFDLSTPLGHLQKFMNENLPLRTPSSPITIESQQTDIALDLLRPMVMAVGFATLYREQTSLIQSEAIPTLESTQWERQQKQQQDAAQPRYYRGARLD